MADLEIIQLEAGVFDHRAAGGDGGGGVTAGTQPRGAFLHGLVEGRRDTPFLRREVDVTRGHRQPVAFPHGARADHLDTEIEIPRHLRHHAQLLKVLFTKDRDIGADLREQFSDHGCDTAEEMRPEAILESRSRRTLRYDFCRKSFRVHVFDIRMPDQLNILGGKLGNISRPGARVGTKIFGRRELRRVDEDRDDNLCSAPFGETNQRHMPVMERTHGWHQRDCGLSGTKAIERATQGGNGSYNHGIS